MAKGGAIRKAEKAQHALEIAARRRTVTQLYLARCTERQIATQLGVSPATVHTDIVAVKSEYRAERLEMIEREVIDLEHLEQECAKRYAAEKSVEWIRERVNIKKRRAELLGLDAAKQVKLGLLSDGTRTDDLTDDELLTRYRSALAGGGDCPAESGRALDGGGDA